MVGFEGKYEVSNLGRVRSLDRTVNGPNGCRRPVPGKVLKPVNVNGYLKIALPSKNVANRGQRVQWLVAAAFIGPRPAGLFVNHKNGIKTDNRLENLEYCTPQENTLHAVRTGLMNNRGEKNGMAKFTDEQRRRICELVDSGLSWSAAGREFGASSSAVQWIVSRSKYSRLQPQPLKDSP